MLLLKSLGPEYHGSDQHDSSNRILYIADFIILKQRILHHEAMVLANNWIDSRHLLVVDLSLRQIVGGSQRGKSFDGMITLTSSFFTFPLLLHAF